MAGQYELEEQYGDNSYDEGVAASLDMGKRRFSFSKTKRAPYSFGIGKRGILKRAPYGFGIGKRVPYHLSKM